MALHPDALTTLDRVKEYLNISSSNTSKDAELEVLIHVASDFIETETKRKLRFKKYVEYQNGDGKTGILYTNQYPLQNVISVWDDTDWNFTTATEISTKDYQVYTEGYIQLVDDETIFSKGVRNVKIMYYAGESNLEVVAGSNDKLDFRETSTATLTATIDPDSYDLSSFISEIKSKMESAGSKTYTVSYNRSNAKFKIKTSGDYLDLLWSTGPNTSRSVKNLMGFTSDDTGSTSYESDNQVSDVPLHLQNITCEIVRRLFKEHDDERYGIDTRSDATFTIRFFAPDIMDAKIYRLIQPYRRISIF